MQHILQKPSQSNTTHTVPKTKGLTRKKREKREPGSEGEKVSGIERDGVSDRLSGCSGISSTQRHMILGSEVIPTDEYRAEPRLPHKRKGVVFTLRVWKVYFRNPSCQHETVNLSQGRRVTSTNITTSFFFPLFFSSLRFYQPAKTSQDAVFLLFLSFRCIFGCNHTAARGENQCLSVCVYLWNIHPCDFDWIWKIIVCSQWTVWKYTRVLCLSFHTKRLIPRAVSLYPTALRW